jgi:hypothetical protein
MDTVVDDLHYLELTALAACIKARKISPPEVARAQLDRIAALDGELGSYVHVMADAAMAQAETAQAEFAAGQHRGPLHGVPIALKDLFWTKDFPTAGSAGQAAAYGRRLFRSPPFRDAAEESMEYRLLAGHFVQRPGSRNSGRALLRLARLRHLRFDPRAMRRQRPDRVEAKLGTRQPLWRVRTGSNTGSCRDDCPQRGGCRRDACRRRRTRRSRSNGGIRSGARLSGCG